MHTEKIYWKTIIACNSHSDGEDDEDMEKGQRKETEAQLRLAVEVHYSMDPATQDMQVGHTRGQVEAVVDVEDAAVDVNMVDHDLENGKSVQVVVENCKEEMFDYIRTSLVAEEVQAVVQNHKDQRFDYIQILLVEEEENGRQEPGVVEKNWVYFQSQSAVLGDWILEADEPAQLKDKYCTHLNFYYPGN